jgi:uncharacterized membrane protein
VRNLVFKKLKTHFVSGLVLLSPFFLTVIAIEYLIKLADSKVVDPLFQILPIEVEATFKVILVKIAIALVVVASVCLVGMLAEKFIFRKVFLGAESFLKNIPFFNRIYSSIKEIADAFFGDKSGVFKRVVFIEYPRKGIYTLGFVTAERRWGLHERTGKELVSVFIPHPPNPAAGFLTFAPKEDLVEIDITVEEGLKLIISAGAAVPNHT